MRVTDAEVVPPFRFEAGLLPLFPLVDLRAIIREFIEPAAGTSDPHLRDDEPTGSNPPVPAEFIGLAKQMNRESSLLQILIFGQKRLSFREGQR